MRRPRHGALAGSTVAAPVGYGIGWTLGPVTVEAWLGEETEARIAGYLERYGFVGYVAWDRWRRTS